MSSEDVRFLPRGGVVLPSSIGQIQYGAVPETIKDTLTTPEGVPNIFVVPRHFFARDRGILLAELEFPVYWNYFILGKRTTIVCRPDQQDTVAHVLAEACFGPARPDPNEFARPNDAQPDLSREMRYFRYDTRLGRTTQLSDLVDFHVTDEHGRVGLRDNVELVHDDRELVLLEGGKARGRFAGDPTVPPLRDGSHDAPRPFQRPRLGVTVIGSGHGFDPGNRTSGFLLWIDGRGVLVDPPVDALDWLAGYDVHARHVDTLVLTHCHADHDGGTLQKILQEDRITLYTTPTVLSSFVNKYARLMGMRRSAFRKLFDFVPVHHGEPITLHGAHVVFRYSFHSIPCIGLEVSHGGKSLVYPSDTLYDPDVLIRLRDQEVLTQERARQLIRFPAQHELILHEAGVPPIHTPFTVLARLEESVKKRLHLVHVSAVSIPADSGLNVARTGLEHTIDLQPSMGSAVDLMEVLDIMSHCDILAELPASRAAEFVRATERKTWPAGTRFIARGERGEDFFVIISGQAAVYKNGHEFKVYSSYDYLGESALVTDHPRSADVYAKTELTALVLRRSDFLRIMRGTRLLPRLAHLARLRELPSWELLEGSDTLKSLTPSQRTQLQTLMEPVELEPGTRLDHEPVLVGEGRVEVLRGARVVGEVGPGALAGDAQAIFQSRPHTFHFRCCTKVAGYRLPVEAFRHFLLHNPGVAMRLAHSLTGPA
ncbi:MAG TPA: cyclic nucleotide-binding domain-containing protein [Candidatus Xenobia bacterium]